MATSAKRRPNWLRRDARAAIAIGLASAILMLGIQYLGGWQALELSLYDRLVRSQPVLAPDPRLLIVAISESDVRRHGRWPLSDRRLATLLDELQRHQPRTIGIDLVRDVAYPPGHAALVQQLQADNLIGIQFLSREPERRIAPPSSLPPERVGFSNVVVDPDARVRRNLLFNRQDEQIYQSFSLQLALHYIAAAGIVPELSSSGDYQLGDTPLPRLQATDGGYQTIDVPNYQILLDYRAPERVARTVSLEQVLAGEIRSDWIRDKIVLIGPNLPSVRDSFFTPYSGFLVNQREMSGVILQAQMLSQLLSAALDGRAPAWFWPDWLEALWLVLWALAGSAIAWRCRQPGILVGALLTAIALLIGINLTAFQTGGWLPGGAPLVALAVSSIGMSIYAEQTARHQFDTVRRLLGQQTSPAIADALWQARDRLLVSGQLAGRTMTATIIFADIRNFSTVAEQHTAGALLAWLNSYLNAMTVEVVQHGGLVNKFTGDGLMALFGVPVPRQSWAEITADAQNAVRCALAFRQRLPQLNDRWQQQQWQPVQLRVGIYTGPVAVGSLGGTQRLEYGAIGDSVNIAARLQSYQKERQPEDCRILITRETLCYLEEHFAVESWGSLPLKGREHCVEIFRVLPQAALS